MTTALQRSNLQFQIAAPRAPLKVLSASSDALAPSTGVHPAAVAIPLLSAAWFLLVAWAAFAHGETSLVLAVVTFLCLIFFGLIVGGAAMARDVSPEQQRHRSFAAFLCGDVDIATGRISGRQALIQIAVMPISLATCATILAFIAVNG